MDRPRGSGRKRTRSGEVESLADVLEAMAGDRPWAAGMALGTLARAWGEVVGERLAAECEPATLSGGVLIVRATSAPWGTQVRFLAEGIREGANRVLGEALVEEVRVVVRDR